jgi:hypothetical protein
MTEGARIDLDVLAPLPAEHPPFQAAARHLSQLLGAATGIDHQVRLNLRKSLNLREIAREPGVIIISLLNEAGRAQSDWTELAARWRRQAAALVAGTPRPVFLCTVFRHVPDVEPAPAGWSRDGVLERVRRLNLLAAELSQATGANVIDIDRTLAHFGARVLATDYTLKGRLGPEVAGSVIAAAVLGAGLDDLVAEDRLEKARHLQGGLDGLTRQLQRHIATRRTAPA